MHGSWSALEFPGKTLLAMMMLWPLVIPGVVLGISILAFFSRVANGLEEWLQMDLDLLRPGLSLVVLGQLSFILTISTLIIAARLRKFDRSLEEAAFDLGASRTRVLRSITLPFLRPALIGAGLVALLMSFENFNTTLMLVGSDAPLPITMYGQMREGATPGDQCGQPAGHAGRRRDREPLCSHVEVASCREGSAAPGALQNVDPVLVAELAQGCVVVAMPAHGIHKAGKARHVADFRRNRGAIEIGSEADAIDADMLDQVIHVADHLFERRMLVALSVRTDEGGGEIHPDHAVALADSGKLLVERGCANGRRPHERWSAWRRAAHPRSWPHPRSPSR